MSIIEGRNAEILQSIIDGEPYENPNPYPSRIEQLLMELKEVIEQGGSGTVDQTYTPTSENAQSGKAVAEALEKIPSVTVEQTYDATSANAQSGTAVAQAVAAIPTVTAEDIASAITRDNSTNWQIIVSGAAKIGDFVFLHLCFMSPTSETISTNDTKIAQIATPYHPATEAFVQCNGYDYNNNILSNVRFWFQNNGDILIKCIGSSSIITATFPQFSMCVMYKVST